MIEAFVSYLADKLYPGLHVTDWPDKNPGSISQIDAVAQGNGMSVAIEHTSIDIFKDKRLDDSRFIRLFAPLEEEFRERTDLRVCLTVKTGAVPTGESWDAIQDSIRDWIKNHVPSLPSGVAEYSIPGVPFPVTMRKPSMAPRLYFSRFTGDDSDFGERLRDLIVEKAKKLGRYRASADSTILLVENNDIANMNPSIMIGAVADYFPNGLPEGVDRIWYADTSISGETQFWNLTPSSRSKLGMVSATEELQAPPE